MEALTFSERLKGLSDELETMDTPKVALVELEFGYSYMGHIAADNGYEPIPSIYGQSWFPSVSEAKEAMEEDNRWMSQLFLISRPKPQGARRLERF